MLFAEGTEQTYDALCQVNGAALYTRTVIEGHGHIDCIFGHNAVVDVYPDILAHLDETTMQPRAAPSLTFRDPFLSPS